jgi:hypothetical protein
VMLDQFPSSTMYHLQHEVRCTMLACFVPVCSFLVLIFFRNFSLPKLIGH